MATALAANKTTRAANSDQYLESNDADVLNLDEHREVVKAREMIESLVNNPDLQKFISEETLKSYTTYLEAQKGPVPKEAAANSNNVPHADSLEGLLMMHTHLSRQWEAAKERLERIKQSLHSALEEKIANDADIDFLIDHLILTGKYDLTEKNALKFEEVIGKKIERMRKNRNLYNKQSKNKFAGNIAIKSIEKTHKIKLNDETSFLKASVPERRAFLKEMKEALMKEEVQAAYNEKNKEKMVKLYIRKLSRKLSKGPGKGCIGEKTFKVFEKELNTLDLEGLKVWHEGFNDEMAPREAFWKEVRATLKGKSLADMEEKIHHVGFGQMKEEFEKAKELESQRLCEEYDGVVEREGKGILWGLEVDKFKRWIRKIPLSSQYKAKGRIREWEALGQYKELRKEIEGLDEKDRKFMESKMESKIDSWGYTEFSEKLKEFKASGQGNEGLSESEKVHASIQNSTIKTGAEEIWKNLEGRSTVDQVKFMRILEVHAQKETEIRKRKETDKGEASDLEVVENQEGEEVVENLMADQKTDMTQILASYSGSKEEAQKMTVSVNNNAGQESLDLQRTNAHSINLFLKAKRKEAAEAELRKAA